MNGNFNPTPGPGKAKGPQNRPHPGDKLKPKTLSDLLQHIVRKAKPAQKALSDCRKAQRVLAAKWPQFSGQLSVSGFRSGVVTLDAASAALFQEIEGFLRQPMLEALREAGLKVREIRVRLRS
jgi:hypothetical protein